MWSDWTLEVGTGLLVKAQAEAMAVAYTNKDVARSIYDLIEMLRGRWHAEISPFAKSEPGQGIDWKHNPLSKISEAAAPDGGLYVIEVKRERKRGKLQSWFTHRVLAAAWRR